MPTQAQIDRYRDDPWHIIPGQAATPAPAPIYSHPPLPRNSVLWPPAPIAQMMPQNIPPPPLKANTPYVAREHSPAAILVYDWPGLVPPSLNPEKAPPSKPKANWTPPYDHHTGSFPPPPLRCRSGQVNAAVVSGMAGRECSVCVQFKPRSEYSSNQLKKTIGSSTCSPCVSAWPHAENNAANANTFTASSNSYLAR